MSETKPIDPAGAIESITALRKAAINKQHLAAKALRAADLDVQILTDALAAAEARVAQVG